MAINVNRLVKMGADLAFAIVPDAADAGVKRAGTYHRVLGSTYEPAAGTAVASERTVAVDFLLGPYRQREPDGDRVRIGDERAVVRMADLAIGEVGDVGADDFIVSADGKREVVDVLMVDPTKQVAVLHVRRVPPDGQSDGSSSTGVSS